MNITSKTVLVTGANQVDAAQVEGLVHAVVERFGRLDIPVDSAGSRVRRRRPVLRGRRLDRQSARRPPPPRRER